MPCPPRLRPFLEPGTIVLWGASPNPASLGHAIWSNLAQSAWAERVIAINPKYTEIDGQACAPSLNSTVGPGALALVAAPWAQLPSIRQACSEHGVQAMVLYGAAHARMGSPQGEEFNRQALRLWGPGTLGYALPHRRFNALALHKAVPKGGLGFVSQSNAVAASVLDWQHNDEFGFSAVFCPGQGSDVDVSDLVDYLAIDPHTDAILLYLESLRDARRFLSAVRAAAAVKPVIVVKAARHVSPSLWAARHGDLAVGDDAVWDAALRRCGALRVASLGDMFSAARALSNARKPRGARLAVVSNGGSPLVMAADAAAMQAIPLAQVAAATLARLQSGIPHPAYIDNPVDLLFDADADRYAHAVQALLDDPGVDGVLTILTPNTFVDPLVVAQTTIDAARQTAKPILTCWMGESSVRPARAQFAAQRMASFRTPEAAVIGFAFLVDWVRNQAQLQETPAAVDAYTPPDLARAAQLLARDEWVAAQALDTPTTHALLGAFHITVSPTSAPGGPRWAVALHQDPVFGAVIALHPAHDKPHYALAPLNQRLASEVCASVDASLAGAPYQALQRLLLRVSEMAAQIPALQRLRLDLDSPQGAQVVLATAEVRGAGAPTLQYRHMAICPYPQQCQRDFTTRAGVPTRIRPIWPEDAAALQDFVRALSARSRYYRFFNAMNELPQRMLARYTQIDYAREMTLVALVSDGATTRMVGEANYATLPDAETCEFALVVADAMAGQGLGAALMQALMDTARAFGLRYIEGEVLANNHAMLALMESLDFDVRLHDDETVVVSRSL